MLLSEENVQPGVEVCFKSEIGSKEKYFTAIEICEFSVTAGVRAKEPRDYSVVGTKTERAFNAMGALATIAFAFNTGILPEVQVHAHHIYPPSHITHIHTSHIHPPFFFK